MKFKNSLLGLGFLVWLLSACSNNAATTNLSVEAFEKEYPKAMCRCWMCERPGNMNQVISTMRN